MFRGVLIDLPEEKLSGLGPLNLPSILPPLQTSFITHTLERLELLPNRHLVQALKKFLNLAS